MAMSRTLTLSAVYLITLAMFAMAYSSLPL